MSTSATTTAPQASELVTANWVRGLFAGGSYFFNLTNAHPWDATWYQASATTNSAGQARTYAGVTNNQYLGTGIMSTQDFSTVYSPMTVNAYLSYSPTPAKAVTVKPELYYVLTNNVTGAGTVITQMLGDFDCGGQALTPGTNLYTFTVPFPTISPGTNFFVIRRFKVVSQTGNPDVTIHGSGSTPSHISFSTPPAASAVDSSITNGLAGTNFVMNATNDLSTVLKPWATNSYPWTNLTVAHASAVTNGYPWTNIAANAVNPAVTNGLYGPSADFKTPTNTPTGDYILKASSTGGATRWEAAGGGSGDAVLGASQIWTGVNQFSNDTRMASLTVTGAVAAANLTTPTNTPTDDYVLTASSTGGATKWAQAAGGSQTPLTGDINGGGFSQTNLSSVSLTNGITVDKILGGNGLTTNATNIIIGARVLFTNNVPNTYLDLNPLATSIAGRWLDRKVGGTSRFYILTNGSITIGADLTIGGAVSWSLNRIWIFAQFFTDWGLFCSRPISCVQLYSGHSG